MYECVRARVHLCLRLCARAPAPVCVQVLYFVGYSKGVGSRMWGAGAYIPQFALYGISIASAIFLMQRKAPY